MSYRGRCARRKELRRIIVRDALGNMTQWDWNRSFTVHIRRELEALLLVRRWNDRRNALRSTNGVLVRRIPGREPEFVVPIGHYVPAGVLVEVIGEVTL